MGEERRRITIPVAGMSCVACARRVEKALSQRAGVSEAGVNFATGRATVAYDPDAVRPGELVGVIEDAEYEAEVREASFDVSDMSCAHCKAAVEKELGKLTGVEYSKANPEAGTVEVRYDEGKVTTDDLQGTVEEAGYTVVAWQI